VSQDQLYLQIAVWSQVVSSVVFIAALVYMWFRFLLPVFLAAQERSNAQIAEAERHRDEVKAALQALQEEIESAQRDAGLIEQRAGEHADHERSAMLDDAKQAGERALADAGKELQRARAAARSRFRDEILGRALTLARQDAKQRAGPALDAVMVERFVNSVEHGSSG
jgi:F0F1-type ATP synthase membrane subunit b/b'